MTPASLRQAQRRLGVETQKEFADLLSVNRYYVSQMLAGHKPVTATVERAVNALLDENEEAL